MNHTMRLALALATVLLVTCAGIGYCAPVTGFGLSDTLAALRNNTPNLPSWNPASQWLPTGSADTDSFANARIAEQYGKLPLSFVENRGQLNSAVRYVIRGPLASAFFTDNGVTFNLMSPSPLAGEGRGEGAVSARNHRFDLQAMRDELTARASTTRNCAALRMEFEGADPNCRVEGIDELPGKVNYFTGSDSAKWHTDIPTFKGVIYRGVWPGVDVSYHGDRRQLKYDIRVARGADLSQIRLRYEGAENLRLDDSGDLHVQTAVTTFVERVPGIYQESDAGKQAVRGGYVLLDDHTVGFLVEGRDPDLPLVIDPASDLLYSTLLGGSGYHDWAYSIAIDASGCAYVAGWTDSSDFPTTPGAFQRTDGGGYHGDAFVTKLNASGSALIYSTYLGGSNFYGDGATSIAVDSFGCAYVTGYTTSYDFPTTSGAFQSNFGGPGGESATEDAFVTKLNAAGSALIYSTFLGGSENDYGNAIAIDSSGCAYVAGETRSGECCPSNFPTTIGAFQSTFCCGGYLAFVTKLNAGGSALIYSTFLGGRWDYAYSIAVDSSDCAYVAGRTQSSDFPTTPGAFQRTYGGGYYFDAFVTKLNTSGSAPVYSTFLGGSSDDSAYSIAIDPSGCAYVAGGTRSSDFPTTPGAFQRTFGGGYGSDAFVTKLNTSGSAPVYSTYLGGTGSGLSGGDYANSIAVDSSGCAYVAGGTGSSDFPTTPGAFQTTYGGGDSADSDVFVAKLNTGGSAPVYSTYLGSSLDDWANSIAIDSSGCAYVAGVTGSNGLPGDFPTTPGAFQTTHGGDWSAFVAKLSTSPGGATVGLSLSAVTVGQTITVTVYAPGATSVTLSFSGGGVALPTLSMTSSGGDTWTRTFATSFLSACRGSSVRVRATAYLAGGGTATGSATLWKGSGPSIPLPPGSQLNIFSDDSDAYGLASSDYQVWNPGGNPLNAELFVNQYMDMWFGLDVHCSGTAYWDTPTGYSVPESMGKVMLVNPRGSIAEIGHFRNQGDSVTMSLNFNSNYAPVINAGQVLLNLVPGGSSVSPNSVVNGLNDFKHIKAVSDAAQTLFGSRHSSTWEWTKAAGSALWSLKSLVSNSAQRAALASAFAKTGLHVGESNLKFILQGAGAWDLLKFISSDIVYLVQTGGDTIDCTFQAYGTSGSGSAPQAIQSMSGTPVTNDAPLPAQTSVTWQAVPRSATDWLISYSVANQGTNPVWSFTVFYEPSVGAPTAILDPAGWTHDLDTTAGTVTWYTEGPGGWVNGDFGTASIQPNQSLSGFGIRHTAPPDYSMCSSTDTGYGTCLGQVPAPAPAQGISAAKMRTENDEVWLSDTIATVVFPDGSYYVEDPERTCGIKVIGSPAPNLGDKVRIVGTLAVVNGEAQVNAGTCLTVGTGPIGPLDMPGESLGGDALGLQPGITGASGPCNIGLLVRTSGNVTQIGTDYVYLDDGSHLKDGTLTGPDENVGVRVICHASSYHQGDSVTITGISSCFVTPAGSIARRVLSAVGPSINSVTVSPSTAAIGDSLHVIVNVTDLEEVSSVTGNAVVTLTKTGASTWEGDVAASTVQRVDIVATDVLAHSANATGSYKTASIVCMVGKSFFGDPIMAAASSKWLFKMYGKVSSIIDANSFYLDDGSGVPIRVVAPGYSASIESGACVSARGVLHTDTSTLECTAEHVIRHH